MPLVQFKEVSKIDSRIQKIHQELATLYERRTVLTQAGEQRLASSNYRGGRMTPIEKEYAQLVNIWHRYGLKPPTFKYLKPALSRAIHVMQDMIAAKPELKGKLSVVLVPPTKELQQTAIQHAMQPFIRESNSVDALAHASTSLKWRLLVAYTAKEGLVWDTPRTTLADGLYMIGGHDARALGRQEYLALTLHVNDPLDQESWSMLLAEADEAAEVLPCATFEHGSYRFDYDDLDNIFGDNRFRPAVEV